MRDTGIDAFNSLGADINKQKGQEPEETDIGVVSDKLPELELKMKNEDIVKLANKWEAAWSNSPKRSKWLKDIDENEKYWLGNQFDTPSKDMRRSMVDNLIFESLETYLPQATRRNPEPLVALKAGEEPNPANEKFTQKVKDRLADIADEDTLRLKLKKGARHWAIMHLGVAKMGWNLDEDRPTARIVRAKKIILDPDSIIDEDGYSGNRVGEYRKLSAERLLEIMGEEDENKEKGIEGNKKAIAAIKEKVKDDLATEVQFIEWWTNDYMFWKLGNHILFKKKNHHWNYDTTEPDTDVDKFGVEEVIEKDVDGINHLSSPQMPYIFLTVFNLGDQPMDNTGLIQQNLANQDVINKRNKQIDKNTDSMNNGMVVSMERAGVTKDQAASMNRTLRKGGTVVIPQGSPREAIDRINAPGLPADVYNNLSDMRARMRDIFGVKGSSQAGLAGESTVRGKIVSRNLDTDRIGGGVTEYLEQFADKVYNWYLQLLFVYDEDFQFLQGARPPKILISVKEGSLLPKDSTTIANQAIELSVAGKMSDVDLFKRLEYPNPEELAANVWLQTNAPEILYKDNPLIQEALAMQAEAAIDQGAVIPPEEEGPAQPLEEEPAQPILDQVPLQ